MKSLVLCVSKVLEDSETWCGVSTHRDFKTITSRVKYEGISFLTITLPNYSKCFERCIEQGRIDSNSFPGFALDKRGFPRFLGGFLRQVFNTRDGTLADTPSTLAIFFIRQICNLAKKIELECTPSRTRKAYREYVSCENEVKRWTQTHDPVLDDQFRNAASVVFGTSIVLLGRKVRELQHVPRHGPGATAEKLSANDRYTITRWHDRLQPFFPSDYFCIPNSGFGSSLRRIDFIEPGAEQPVRVVTVPKTLKTPRIIAIEPSCVQYAQQSLLEMLVPELERQKYFGALGFLDQQVNRDLAEAASKDKRLATLDLSEASDRVSNHLVELLCSFDPDFSGAVQACRSTRADVPGHGTITLSKFASMGSALCFPMEAMVFLTILRVADCMRLGVPCTSRIGLSTFLRRVRVYGDDIIIPVELTPFALQFLQAYGLKVNRDKSFWKSNFRESCGGDFYDGEAVKPTYLRRLPQPGATKREHSELVSLISTRNQLYRAGLWKTCAFLDRLIGRVVPFPIVEEDSPIHGRHSVLPWVGERTCSKLHRPEVRGLQVVPRSPSDSLDGIGALMKFFLKRGDKPRDKDHLVRYGRPRSVHTKIAWSTPY